MSLASSPGFEATLLNDIYIFAHEIAIVLENPFVLRYSCFFYALYHCFALCWMSKFREHVVKNCLVNGRKWLVSS